jgi:hypothetical protein
MRVRIIIFLFWLFIPMTALMAQSTSDKFTQSVRAYGVTVYYPDNMISDVNEGINISLDSKSIAVMIGIIPPQALDEAWGISPTILDKAVVMEQFIDALSGRFADLSIVTDIIGDVPIGGYDGIQRVVRYNILRDFIYAFDTPMGVFIARLVTDVEDETLLVMLLNNIIKAMDISARITGELPDGVIGRVAPTPDVRMSDRMTSVDRTITYQMPIDWVRDVNDTSEDSQDVFADSQATHDALGENFNIAEGTAVGILPDDILADWDIDAQTAYDFIRQLSDLLNTSDQRSDIITYTNLPYVAYVSAVDVELLPSVYLVAIQPADSDLLVTLVFITGDFERDEPYLIAILNSIRPVTSPTN